MTSRQTSTKVPLRRDAQGPLEQAPSRQDRLAAAIDEYYAAVDQGQAPDREQLLAKYSDIADELADCLQNLDFIQNVAPQLSNRTASPDASPDGPPSVNLGDFRILRELGRGGMGVVYEAEQLSLGRRVALKVLPFAAMLDRQQLKRFKNEARAAATLDHPNIVAVFSVGEERGVHYYAMQLVEGQSLAEVIGELRKTNGVTFEEPAGEAARTVTFAKQRHETSQPTAHNESKEPPRVSPTAETKRDLQAAVSTVPAFDTQAYYRSVAQLGVQAARGLDHAHQYGILHRDVKPGNLMVDMDGQLQVTDFGLARIESDAGMTMTGDFLGTLAYMSPEQALAKRVVVDHRSDIYSLGVTLYELLTLHPAYIGKDRQELLKRIALDEPRRPRQVNSRIPRDLETIVCKAIEKSPDDRYATAQELADDLQRFLSDQPIKACPPNLRQRVIKWSRRNQLFVVGSALVATILAAALTVSTLLIWQEKQQTQAALDTAEEQRTLADENAQKAEQSAAESEALVDFFVNDLLGAIDPAKGTGEEVTVAEVVEAAETKLDEGLEDDPLLEAKIRFALAKVNASLSKHSRAEDQLRKALAIHRKEHDFNEDTYEMTRELGFRLKRLGQYTDSSQVQRDLQPQLERFFGKHSEEAIDNLGELAVLNMLRGKPNKAKSLLAKMRVAAEGTVEPVRSKMLAFERWHQARIAEIQRDFGQAKEYLKEAMQRGTEHFTDDDQRFLTDRLAHFHYKLGEHAESRGLREKALAGRLETNAPADHKTLEAMVELAWSFYKLSKDGEGDYYERARALMERAAATAYENQQWDALHYACWHALSPGFCDRPQYEAKYSFLAAIAISHAEATHLGRKNAPADNRTYYFIRGTDEMAKTTPTEQLQMLHDEAAALLPEVPPATRAKVLAMLGSYESAAEQFTIAVNEDPDDQAVAIGAALVHAANGDRQAFNAMVRRMRNRFGTTTDGSSITAFTALMDKGPELRDKRTRFDEVIRIYKVAIDFSASDDDPLTIDLRRAVSTLAGSQPKTPRASEQ